MARISKTIIAAAAALLQAQKDGPATLGAVATSQLLEFYNAHAERFGEGPVKRFPSRESAELRALGLAKKIVDASNATPAEKTKKEPGDLGAAIAESWKNPEVAARRAARHAVQVGKETYKSVRAAFEALGLPMNQHVKFRGQLVAAGAAEFDGHKFKVVQPA